MSEVWTLIITCISCRIFYNKSSKKHINEVRKLATQIQKENTFDYGATLSNCFYTIIFFEMF